LTVTLLFSVFAWTASLNWVFPFKITLNSHILSSQAGKDGCLGYKGFVSGRLHIGFRRSVGISNCIA
jgi:hypothetical protein